MMWLKFMYKGRLIIPLEVTENDTLQQIIRHIQENYGTPSVVLSFNGKPLATEADYLAANLTDGSEITLHFEELPESPGDSSFNLNEYPTAAGASSSQPPLSVKYSYPFARTVGITPTVNDTVLQLKAAIQEDIKIQEDIQIPICQIVIKDQFGYELTDAITLRRPQNPGMSELAAEFLPPPPAPTLPPPAMIRVVLQYGNARSPAEVAAAGNVSQLRTMLDAKVNVPHPYFFVHGQVPIDENRSFFSQNISERAIIKIVERVPVNTAGASSSQPPTPMLPPPAMMIRVVLQYGNARSTAEVAAAGNVSQLRTMLDVPHPYFFVLGQVPIDENRSFLSQNISERAIIKILERVPVNFRFQHKSGEPNAYFDVFAHSDDTILELKRNISTNGRIPVDRLLIKKDGIELPDHKALHACSITSESRIDIYIQ